MFTRLENRIEPSLTTLPDNYLIDLLRFVTESTVIHGSVRHDGCVSVLSQMACHAFPRWIGGHMKVMSAQLGG